MKAFLAVVSLLFVLGCSDLKQMNANMRESNQIVSKNVDVMQASTTAIEANTAGVEHTTETMRIFILLFAAVFAILIILLFQVVRSQQKLLGSRRRR